MAGTIQFEKSNGGNAYRTAFYTKDINLDNNSSANFATGTTFAPMYEGESAPSGTPKVRSYEVYVDETVSSTGDDGTANVSKIVNRLARIAPTGDTSGNYDVQVVETNIIGENINSGTLTITNTTGVNADFRVVFVCGA